MFYTRLAEDRDVKEIMVIISQAIAFLNEQQLPQWQNGQGPSKERIKQDIDHRLGYVVVDHQTGQIAGYAMLQETAEAAYATLEGGLWDHRYPRYATIHRVAVAAAYRGQGVAKILLQNMIMIAYQKEYYDVRIDTYPQNFGMQRVIASLDFIKCGQVQFPMAHGERLAYQLLLTI